MRSREMIRMIEGDGWYLVNTKGSHRQYKHPSKPGRVTIKHPDSDIPIKTISSILKQAGLNR
ncbi:YcfA-like protein [Paucimonas lemoignei]|nr:YcfA-like protein [Paucimonas lemoignei]